MSAEQYAADLLADLSVARATRGSVFAEGLPRIDISAFVEAVARKATQPTRLAVLGGPEKLGRPPSADLTVTSDPTVANVWRNDGLARKGTRTIFLVVGAAPKLNSLRSAITTIGPRDLRAFAVTRCIAMMDTAGRRAFWTAVGDLAADIPLSALLDATSQVAKVAERGRAALIEAEPDSLPRLKLLPTRRFFETQGLGNARKLVQRGLALVNQIQSLTPKERERLAAVAENRNADQRVRAVGSALLRFERSGSWADLHGVSMEEAEAALKAKPPAGTGHVDDGRAGGTPSGKRMEGDELALDLVLTTAGRGLVVAAKRFAQALDTRPDEGAEPGDDEEIQVGGRTILPRPKVGSSQTRSLLGELLSADAWGGVVVALEAPDFVSALKAAGTGSAELQKFEPATRDGLRDTLKRAVDMGRADRTVLSAWEGYAVARAALVEHAASLADHPLLAIAGNDRVKNAAQLVLDTYPKALQAIHDTATALEKTSHDAARRLRGWALCLDVAFFLTEQKKLSALLAPTHPFHLWRWMTFCEILGDNLDELKRLGEPVVRALLADPPVFCPALALSPYVTRHVTQCRALMPVGNFAALPLFAEPIGSQAAKFRSRSVGEVAKRLLRLMPHASLGLRVALIDPPSVVGALEDLVDLESTLDDGPVPVHLSVYRTRPPLEATDEEEDDIVNLSREVTDGGGVLQVSSALSSLGELADILARQPVHLAVLFDPASGEVFRTSLTNPPRVSPLSVPRAYRYDDFDDRLDVVVAGDIAPFKPYHELLWRALEVPREDFVGRRSGASLSARELARLARGAVWAVVVDQGIEPTLRIDGCHRLDWRSDGGRDVVTFSCHVESIHDLVADAVRAAGLIPDDETTRRMLRELFELNGEAVLSLARPRPGVTLVEPRAARGTLGVLCAVRWYRSVFPEALVVSLDDPMSRRWILGFADEGDLDRRGDLLAVRASETGVVIDVLEAKAHESAEAGLTTHGTRIEGPAVEQLDASLRKVAQVLAAESPVSAARMDVLRDQLYRAVASRPYDSAERARHVRLLEQLFSEGAKELRGVVVRVRIDAGGTPVAPATPAYLTSRDGNRIGVVDLVEVGVLASGPMPTVVPPASEATRDTVAEGSKLRGADGGSSRLTDREAVTGGGPEVKILLGSTSTGQDVFWEPHQETKPLDNFGFLVTGDPGSGKTETIRSVVAGVLKAERPVCVFDFKNDYSGSDFASRLGLAVYDVDRRGLPFNPFDLLADDRGECQPIRQVHELAGILRRVFGLHDQQEARLKNAMITAYEGVGIDPKARRRVETLPAAPTFGAVHAVLRKDDEAQATLNRLSPLFDLDLFPETRPETGFDELLASRVVLDLHTLPTDQIKAALSEFMIVRLHQRMLRGDQPRRLRRVLVFDEAWRVKDSQRLEALAREGRAFGVGLLVGTQFPGDIPPALAGNLATQLLLHNSGADHRKAVIRTLCGATSGADADRLGKQILHLQKFQGFLRNQQHQPYVLMEVLPFHRRVERGLL